MGAWRHELAVSCSSIIGTVVLEEFAKLLLGVGTALHTHTHTDQKQLT